MGIPGLWDVLGEGEVRHIADYASEHFKQHGRPLRIAVDEATWRFTNLTDDQVKLIRDGEPAANPIEKTILWRILRLWRLNIQLLFVWDGMRKPGKERRAGRGGGKVDHAIVKMLHRMFDLLRVPYHQAPGEAEAECARLQSLGIVDAVWSDDGDSLMFGCTTLIKQHKVAQKAVKDHIRIYRASVDLEKHDFDARSLVVFALVAGGDYDTTGIKGCGTSAARAVSKRKYGLGQALDHVMTEKDLPAWRDSLIWTLRRCRRDADIPDKFPAWKPFLGYRDPAVSTDDQLRNLRGLRDGWERPINETKLREELRVHYNFTTREYQKHLGPVFLVRKLVNANTPDKQAENLTYEVQMKRTRKAKPVDGEEPPAKSEAKIKYSAARLVGIDVTSQPDDEDWTKFAAKNGTPYDPLERINCEIPCCFLQHGLPEGSYEAPPPKGRKKRAAAEDEVAPAMAQDDSGPARHGSPVPSPQPAKGTHATGPTSSSHPPAKKRKASTSDDSEPKKRKKTTSNDTGPRKRAKPAKDAAAGTKPAAKRKRKTKEPEPQSPTPPPSKFRTLDIPDFLPFPDITTLPKTARSLEVIDLGDDSDDEDPAGLFMSPMSNPGSNERSKRANAKSSMQKAPLTTPRRSGYSHLESSSASAVRNEVQTHPSLRRPETVPSSAPVVSKAANIASQQALHTASTAEIMTPPDSQDLVPGETINAATLRELRMAALLNRSSLDVSTKPEIVASPPQQSRKAPNNHMPEVIDLT